MRRQHKFIDALYVGILLLYILGGMALVPFHGDESTIIFMSRDWYDLTHDISRLFFQASPDPDTAARQDLRLLNGPLAAYSIGASWTLFGLSVNDVNQQWLWGADMNYNRTSGHVPSDLLLFIARLPSTVAVMLSTALLFATAKRLAGRWSAWVAALVFALTPAVLLNGRRAMFEGVFLLTSTLLIFLGVWLAQRLDLKKDRLIDWLLFGLASGFALTAKHTAVLLIAPIFGSLLILLLLRRRSIVILLRNAMLVGVLSLGVFFVMNPAWWANPPAMPRRVLTLRQQTLDGQVSFYGGYANWGDRLSGLATAMFSPPQYYESQQGWHQWLSASIADYESAHTGGITTPALIILMLAGIGYMLYRLRQPPFAVFALMTGFILVMTVLLTPLGWQRYYLPLAAPFALLCGLSVGWVNVRKS